MSGLLNNLQNFYPWIAFLAGLGGSLHCVGMCGGLVTATCGKNKDIYRYQFGRLLGYMFLGLFAGFLGSLVKFETHSPAVAIIPGVLLGMMFLIGGIQSLRGKKAEIPMPKFMGKFYGLLWKKLIYKNKSFTTSFFTGLISIFLPCGLLYGIILGGVAIQNPMMAVISMVFFWVGTLPSMVLAPHIFKRILAPLQNKLPKIYAVSLIVIGLMTVSFRVVKLNVTHAATTEERVSAPTCH